MKKSLLTICLAFVSCHASYAAGLEYSVEFAGVNSNKQVFVQFEEAVIAENCTSKQVLLPSNSEVSDKFLSIALMAKATKSKVVFKPKGCIGNNPSFDADASDWAYFYIK